MRFALGALVTLALVPGVARAQVGTSVTRAPTLTVERYPEDWSHLADPAARSGRLGHPRAPITLMSQ